MTSISNPEDRAHLLSLDAAREAAFAAVSSAIAAVAEVDARAQSLRQAIANHNAAEPAQDPDVSAELSDLLAANPAAANSADWAGKLLAAQDCG